MKWGGQVVGPHKRLGRISGWEERTIPESSVLLAVYSNSKFSSSLFDRQSSFSNL
jgi:hypothetical protein